MRSLTILALVFGAAGLRADEVHTYKVDPAHSSVVFKISHLDFSNTFGMFGAVDGQFVVNEAKPEKSSMEVTVKADSVTTLNAKRDEHLRSPDFFNVKRFSEIKFKSSSVKKTGDNTYDVNGKLTLHGVTKPVSFTFKRDKTGNDPWGKTRTGGETSFKIKRSDYKMTFMNKPGEVGDEVELMISLEGIRQ